MNAQRSIKNGKDRGIPGSLAISRCDLELSADSYNAQVLKNLKFKE